MGCALCLCWHGQRRSVRHRTRRGRGIVLELVELVELLLLLMWQLGRGLRLGLMLEWGRVLRVLLLMVLVLLLLLLLLRLLMRLLLLNLYLKLMLVVALPLPLLLARGSCRAGQAC